MKFKRGAEMSKKVIKDKLYAKGLPIEIYTEDYQSEFISLTDIAKYKSWKFLHNPDFKPVEFDGFRK